jgi:hypothetical protein
MKNLRFIILLLFACNSFAQNTISATYGSAIPTFYSTLSFNYNCSLSYLSLTLPAGQTYNVTSVAVTYSMTALNSGQQADQFSSIRFVNTNNRETTEAQNNITTAGTYIYSRTINIANGNYNGSTALVFELGARRSWTGSIFNCSGDENRVDANSWTITVNYSNEIAYSYVGIGTTTPFIAKLDVAGVATGSSSGTTSAVFGSDGAGISIQRNWPALGFNQYRDNNVGFGKYLNNGAASVFAMDPSTGSITLDMYGIGLKNAQVGIGSRAITTSLNYGHEIIGFGGNTDESTFFAINKNTFNTNATAVFAGSSYSSFFCSGSSEDTYIRGGLNNSKLFINDTYGDDMYSGKVKIIGNLAIGPSANQSPSVSTEIYGGLGFTKHPLVNATAATGIGQSNSSFIEVACTGANPLIKLYAGEGVGQILIIKIVNQMKLVYRPFIYIQLQAGDTIMLIGDKIVNPSPGVDAGFYWSVLSVSHNN